MDWSGPFVVDDAVGSTSFADAAKMVPLYDPVDTCLCDDFSASQCGEEQYSASSSLAGGMFASQLVVVTSTLLMCLGIFRRG